MLKYNMLHSHDQIHRKTINASSTSSKNFWANISVFPSNSKPVFTVLGGIPILRMAMLFSLGLKI